jgi:hypothetical protein
MRMVRAVPGAENTGCWYHWEHCLGKIFVAIRREMGMDIAYHFHIGTSELKKKTPIGLIQMNVK